jgi:hypothetical protein
MKIELNENELNVISESLKQLVNLSNYLSDFNSSSYALENELEKDYIFKLFDRINNIEFNSRLLKESILSNNDNEIDDPIGNKLESSVNSSKYDRFNFNKQRLIKMGFDKNKTEQQIMLENGYKIVYDCGNLKYEMIIN